MKIYLTGQNNFGNRGCEALVRSTVDVLRQKYQDPVILVPSLDIPRDSAQWPDAAAYGVQFIESPVVSARFINWSRVCTRMPLLAAAPWPRLGKSDPVRRVLAGCDMVLSIGGDNYSLDYDLGSLAFFVAVAEAALEAGKPALLWGASVGPFSAIPSVERKMATHLQRLTAVTVRESHSVNYLAGIGVSENVLPVVDSAFILRRDDLDAREYLPIGEAGVLGLNLSPLIDKVRRRAGVEGDLIEEAATFIRNVLADSRMGVLLVPHVAPLDGRDVNNDETFLARVMTAVGDQGGRVRQLPSGLNAIQLKQIIAGCRFFIGARTHATIAAMSTGVPTLSIAYSVKARGINLDLFGHERYVLDTRKVNAQTLMEGLRTLESDEQAINTLYRERLPQWRDKAASGSKRLPTLG